jgi:peroxiredoxin
LLCQLSLVVSAQGNLRKGDWLGVLVRGDGQEVVFNFSIYAKGGKTVLAIRNAKERLEVTGLVQQGDSVHFDMPFFECRFAAGIQPDGTLSGRMTKGTAAEPQQWIFRAEPGRSQRFPVTRKAQFNVSGRWAVSITRPNGADRPAIAEFQQQGEHLTGTFLTPSGDYRYLEGVVSGDSLYLSAFDGSHIYLFTAKVDAEKTISGGWYYSGYGGKEKWRAVKDAQAVLPDLGYTPEVKPGAGAVDFSFPDLDSNLVSIRDPRFQGKVVVLQVMGSWCPNCMDETRFLNDYYLKHRSSGVEVLALAYEYTTDFGRSKAGLSKFRDRFKVAYPILITGVRSADSLKTEKTLPQITPIKVFPTTIFVGKDGHIRKIETGFNGPGTGIHYEAYQKEFDQTVKELLRE